ncbi:non-specific lipid transfer protein GPI-anchored 1 [Panicum miliaceum]|uniref:Non-specific lipid transfer protein GPI-anchored 1 n=1 Tax=Panicum miliaceum TaxID=4540 RepID=A0A3L6PRJ7_PANMI|nr:non-specific lipid transfer protein GPI-anchored 1 [Panicum miliaceum]
MNVPNSNICTIPISSIPPAGRIGPSEAPALLNLKPGSPDYALFANASKITPSTGGTPASDSTAGGGFKLQAGFRGSVPLAVLSAVLSSMF